MSLKIRHYGVGLFCVILALLIAIGIYQYWTEWLFRVHVWQAALHRYLTQLLIAVQSDQKRSGLWLIGFSFIYGVVHSIGPGHGKMIVTTYLATQKTLYRQAIIITVLSSLLQAIMAIAFVVCAVFLLSLTRKQWVVGEMWLERLSAVCVILLGIGIALQTVWRQWKRRRVSLHDSSVHHNPGHYCGHHHVPSSDRLHIGQRRTSRLALIVAMGIRPCGGALLMLFFSYFIGIFAWGIAAALLLSVGTAMTLTGIAFWVLYCRRLALQLVQKNPAAVRWMRMASVLFSLLGAACLIVLGLLLWVNVTPISPFILG